MNDHPLHYFYFALGLAIGILAETILGGDTQMLGVKFILVLGIFGIIIFGRSLNRRAHLRYLDDWRNHHRRGEWYFIFRRYLIVRGAIGSVFLIIPGFLLSGALVYDIRYSVFVIVLLVVVLGILGHNEWSECEQEYLAHEIREKGDEARSASALSN